MKKKYFLILIILNVFFVLLITALMFFGFKRASTYTLNETGIIIPLNKPEYHFAMVCPNIDDPFWISMKKGIEKASKELNVAVEFIGPRLSDPKEELKYLNIAIASKVDGIATHISDEASASQLIEKAAEKNIPVVTVQTDAKDSKRISYIGSNIFNLGMQFGKMLVYGTNGDSVALVLINKESNNTLDTQSVMLSGIKDITSKYPKIKIITMETTGNEFLGSEEQVKSTLEKYPEVNTIICTTERDTLGVAQLLVDTNKVGYTVIGYGGSTSVLRYIQNRVIYGTVSGNPEKMGYDAIKALVDIKKGGRTSAYFPVELQLITKGNVEKFINSDSK